MARSKLAIITPVYNRHKELLRLFRSLCEQSCLDFAWYVVDDGSTDSSWNVIESMSSSAPFTVHPYRKQNGGKHTAVNLAVRNVEEDLSFIVDSDDWLPIDSVKTILRYFALFAEEPGICGISFLRRMGNAPKKSSPFPESPMRGTYMDVRINRRIPGDKAEVFYTRCLKEAPFPEFPGERFYHEDGVWVRLSKRYEMYFVNEYVYEGAYLNGGLTLGGRQLKMDCPLGMADRSAQFLAYPGHVALYQRIKHALLWDVYTSIAKAWHLSIESCPAPLLCAVCRPVAALIRRKWMAEAG